MNKKMAAIAFAVLAAALYAVNAPVSKLLMSEISPSILAGLLYIGAGVGMGAVLGIKRAREPSDRDSRLGRVDLPYTVAMVLLDIAAPILLMYGIANTTSANASLLNNFEIVATSLIALLFFGEKISPRLWTAIILVTVASAILGFEGSGTFIFGRGSLLVLGAAVCWGVENNCTRRLSERSSEQIVFIKGVFSGLGSIAVGYILGERLPDVLPIAMAMLLGFVAYGLSINFYIMAQARIGAAKTSAFYSIAPFLGVGFSFLLLSERPRPQFYIGLAVMAVSTVIMVADTLRDEMDGDV